VREEVESGQEKNGVDTSNPVKLERATSLGNEDARLVTARDESVAGDLSSATVEEELRLGKEHAKSGGEERDGGGDLEENLPSVELRNESEVDDGGEQVLEAHRVSAHCRSEEERKETYSDGVTLLENTTGESTSSDGHVLQRGRNGSTPDSTCATASVPSKEEIRKEEKARLTHSDSKEGADSEELLERGNVRSREREHSYEDEVENERVLATVTVRSETKDDGSDGSEEQSKGNRSGDLKRGDVEAGCEAGDRKGDGEKVDGLVKERTVSALLVQSPLVTLPSGSRAMLRQQEKEYGDFVRLRRRLRLWRTMAGRREVVRTSQVHASHPVKKNPQQRGERDRARVMGLADC